MSQFKNFYISMKTKRNYILHPFLLACYSILMPLSVNRLQISPILAIRPLVIVIAMSILVMLILRLFLKDWELVGLVAYLLIVLICFGGYIDSFGDSDSMYYLRLLFIILIVFLIVLFINILNKQDIWKKLCTKYKITLFLNIITSVLLLLPLILLTMTIIDFVRYIIAYQQADRDTNLDRIILTNHETPDIYYILLDGYGRADILRDIYHFDNTPFTDYLTRKGFYISQSSQTNYIQTSLSLASSLNMIYLGDYMGPFGLNSQSRIPLENLIKNSQVVSLLKNQGYQIIAFQSGFLYTELTKSDLYLSPYVSINEFEGLVLANSIFKWFIRESSFIPIFGYDSHRRLILYTLDELSKVPDIPGPKFVFAHIIAPHPPFVFNRNGTNLEPNYAYSIYDGSQFPGSQDEYIRGYVGQIQFLNARLEETITSILERSENPPLIIIQGDHGPGLLLDWFSQEKSCLVERASILNAFYFPEVDIGRLYPNISPVNTFRIIFDTYFGADLELLPDKSYYSTIDKPYNFYEVSSWDIHSKACVIDDKQ